MAKSRYLKRGVLGLVILLVVIQFVPVDRSNPAVEADLVAPEDVKTVLKRACYDCHSHETTWPWYSYVAPVSWLIEHDVAEGREHLNLSKFDAAKEEHMKEEIWDEVSEGEMPMSIYVLLHSEAELSDADKEVLKSWSTGGGKK